MLSKRIELMSVKGRLKAFTHKTRLTMYLGIMLVLVSASVVLVVFISLSAVLTPPTLPAFDLQIKDCYYNSSTGYFSVWGTFGIQVPRDYNYYLGFVSITDGNTTINVRYYHGLWGKEFGSYALYPSPGAYQEGPDWHFYIVGGITLASTNVQLTFEYAISYGLSDNRKVLEKGTKVFSVNVE